MIKVFSPAYNGEIENQDDTLNTLYKRLGNKKVPKLIQVGGPLGLLMKGYDINRPLNELEFIEDHISYFTDICMVDFMKFMLRFTIRELNLVTDYILELYDLIDLLSQGKLSKSKLTYFESLLDEKVELQGEQLQGEQLLQKNLQYILDHYQVEVMEHVEGYCRMSICRGLFDAQCINACPAKIHIPGFVALMKAGNTSEAYQLMRKQNPLSSVCGAVCARPCELRCRRGEITSTVGVRALQRFISLDALESFEKEDCLEDKGHSIGIIGGGPAGLTAAYFLRRSGYDVTIYEKEKYAGGVLAFGVPSYRLPKVLIDDEIETIKALGVKFMTGIQVDKAMYKQLKNKHDKLILATGRSIGRKLSLSHKNQITGIDYLKSVRLNQKSLHGKVLVIGGGDVAMDCARTALRQGCDVTVLSLELYEDMPASFEERSQAKEEGVIFKSGYGVSSIQDNNVLLEKCIQVFDEAGVFKPKFIASEDQLEADHMIVSIGQLPDDGYITDLDDGVYKCGDLVKPTIVIDAIAQGKQVAEQINKEYGYGDLYTGEEIHIPESVLNIRTFDDDLREETLKAVNERVNSFEEISRAYTFEDATYEANRCMRCDRNSKASLRLGREGR